MTRLMLLSSFVVAACAAVGACAANGGTTGAGGASSSSTTASASSSGVAASSSASSSSSAAASSSTGAGGAGGGGCVGKAFKADPIPLDIFVMLDQSGSMLQDAGNGVSKWQAVKDALATFVAQPAVAGIGIGLQFFGLPDPSVHGCPTQPCAQDKDCMNGCTSCGPQGVCQAPSWNPDIDSCDPLDYAWAEVPIQTLPGAANAILTTIGMHAPGTNTPTSPALAGAIDYASSWAKAHPTHVTVVAFATDGGPSECDTDLAKIDAIAAAGLAAKPSIKTFVVGVGSLLQALDGIAAAGGTGQAFHVDVNPMATQQLVAALDAIRGAAIGCSYVIPPPPMGQTIDFGLVNVDYLAGGKAPGATLPNVQDAAHCPVNGDAWYYDDPKSPTAIVLCPSTCKTVSADLAAEVDVVLGCKTILK